MPAASALVVAPFLAVNVDFLLANLLKVHEGGWTPLLVGAALLVVMLTWRRGARILAEKAHREEVPLADFVAQVEKRSPGRVEGTAIFLTGSPDYNWAALALP